MQIGVNAFVVFDTDSCSTEDYDAYFKAMFPEGKLFVYLGEVKQAPGHCILADLDTGKIIGLYHTDNFREARDYEC
jgi:hypothetical protein